MSKIVTVISGKGGSGKTTLAVNLASAFKLLGKKTLLIDCSFGVRNDDIPLGVTTELLYNIFDVITGDVRFEDAVVTGFCEHVPDFLGASVSSLPENFPRQFSRLISDVSRHYEYIIIDTPSSTGAEFDISASCADVILAVSETDLLSLMNTSLCINKLPSEKEAFLVLNKVSMSASVNRYIEDIIDEVGVPLIGVIKYDEFVTQSLESGDPIIRYDTYCGRETENIARRLDNQHIDVSEKMLTDSIFERNKLVLKNISRRV